MFRLQAARRWLASALLIAAVFHTATHALAANCWDGAYASGDRPDDLYSQDSQAGTVVEKAGITTTNLMWKQCVEGLSGAGCSTGTASTMAGTAGASIAAASTVGGYNDWRLPTAAELRSLLPRRCVGPRINANLFPNTPFGYTWATDLYWWDTTMASTVEFLQGANRYDSIAGSSHYVRLVRGGVGNTANPNAQILSFGPAPVLNLGDTVTVSAPNAALASRQSGNPVRYSSTTPAVCSVNASTGVVTLTPAAILGDTCTIAADQYGRINNAVGYAPAAQLTQSLLVKGTQTLRFGTFPVLAVGMGGSISASSGSGLTVALSSTTTDVCTVTSGGVITVLTAGTCTIQADQSGDTTYHPATAITTSITVGKGAQAITAFAPASPVTFGAAPVTLSATGGASNSAITFGTSSPNTVCTVTNGIVTFVGTGTCNVTADQAGNANYNAAAQANASIVVNPLQRTASGPTATASGAQTVSFSGGNANCGFTAAQWVPALSRALSLPPDISFPHGLFRFGTNDCGNGAVLTFTVNLPTAVPPGTPYYKFGKTAADTTQHWYVLPSTLNAAGTQYTFSITDGGLGDDDLMVNGFVSDDGGPGVWGGFTSVPTLGQWGLLLLAGLLAALGCGRMLSWRTQGRRSLLSQRARRWAASAFLFIAALHTAPHALAQNCWDADKPDSQYSLAGPAGTVVDTITNLMWKQCLEGQSGTDCATGVPTRVLWDDASSAAAASRWGGYSDWRLPTRLEFQTLKPAGCTGLTINATVFPRDPAMPIWIGDLSTIPRLAWMVTQGGGFAQTDRATVSNAYRLVRNGPPPTAQTLRFGPVPFLSLGGTATVSATNAAAPSAQSGMAIRYSSATPAICTVDAASGVVTLTNTASAGNTCTVAADQDGGIHEHREHRLCSPRAQRPAGRLGPYRADVGVWPRTGAWFQFRLGRHGDGECHQHGDQQRHAALGQCHPVQQQHALGLHR